MMQLEALINRVAARLEEATVAFGHGTDNAWDEAAWLVLHAAGLSPDAPADLAQSISDSQLAAVEALVEQRITTRTPTAYLTGTAWFAGLPFETMPGVIIPRSHLAEFLLDQGRPWLEPTAVSRALDLCTGSGCIAVAMAHTFPGARIDASDIAPQALQLAQRNVERHGLAERIRVVTSDLFDGLEPGYALIVSNPPYVPQGELAGLPEEFQHEPMSAFNGGVDGLDIVRRILRSAADYLQPRGVLVMEVGHVWPAVERAFPGLPLTWLETADEDAGVLLLEAPDLRDYFAASSRCLRR